MSTTDLSPIESFVKSICERMWLEMNFITLTDALDFSCKAPYSNFNRTKCIISPILSRLSLISIEKANYYSFFLFFK